MDTNELKGRATSLTARIVGLRDRVYEYGKKNADFRDLTEISRLIVELHLLQLDTDSLPSKIDILKTISETIVVEADIKNIEETIKDVEQKVAQMEAHARKMGI
ncbi:MAG TPA: hypothetical protein VD887_12820 [Allosphingosinicella sp.]|nr:hypothetical protein [Allosphingosinicella sp.]